LALIAQRRLGEANRRCVKVAWRCVIIL